MIHQCGIVMLGHREGNITWDCPPVVNKSSTSIKTTQFQMIVQLYFISVFCLIGLFGNVVSVIVLWKDKERRHALFLLQALAVADGFYLIMALLKHPTRHLIEDLKTYNQMDLYVYPLLKVAETVCIWMMVLVTVDRYMYVCSPLRASKVINRHNRHLWALGVFAIGCLYNLPQFFDSCVMTFVNGCTGDELKSSKVISPYFHSTLYFDIYMYTAFICLMYIVPLVTLCVLNARLVMTIRRSRIRQRQYGGHTDHNDMNATLVLVILVVVFIVCETPELILRILSCLERWFASISFSVSLFRVFSTVNEFLMVVNSSINFFIYVAYGKRFRFIMKETFKYGLLNSTASL